MTAKTGCSSCGAKISTSDRFCGVCGADLGGAVPAAQPASKPGANFNKTMLGVSLPQVLGQAAQPAPVQTPQPAPQPAAEPARSVPKAVPQRTMLGMAAPLIGDAAKPGAPATGSAALAASSAPIPKHTLLGVSPIAAPIGPQALTPAAPRAQAPAEAAPTPVAPSPAKLRAQTDRTMLGIAAHALPTGSAELGVADTVEQAAPELAGSRAQARQRSFTPVPGEDDTAGSLRPVAAPALRWLWLAVGALAVLVVGGAVLAWWSMRGADLRVHVVTQSGSEFLEVEAPGSAPGAKLRFLGAEQPLHAGRARFAVKADLLTIGDNRLAIDLLEKDGSVSSSTVTLKVAYRVRLDTTKLGAPTPGVEVVVDAVPGSKVTLDGAALALNEHGHAARPYPVAAQSGGVFAFSAKYHVEPPGEPAEDGKLDLSLPLASMQVDRPGPEVVTDQAVLEVAGAVEPGAQVDIDGHTVDVIDGRFLFRAELGAPGEHVLHVVARAKGKAPRVNEIKVQRVADLTLAAASFTPDPALNYARIAQSPAVYRGQKVAFDGRVYNVEIDAGKSVLQMLVFDCPGQNRCPLWVEYPQATEATIDSWVRVLGVIAGEQQFRSKQNQVQTVPSVHAQYVLKLAKK